MSSADHVMVYVWPYHGLHHFGHAAVKIGGATGVDRPVTCPRKGIVKLPSEYISWWPAMSGDYTTERQQSLAEFMERIAWFLERVNPVLEDLPTPGSGPADVGRMYQEDKRDEMSFNARRGLAEGSFQPRLDQRQMTVASLDQYSDPRDFAAVFRSLQQRGLYPVAKDNRIFVYAQQPEKIALPIAGLGGARWGLDGMRMYQWWCTVRSSPRLVYSLISRCRNCAGLALAALKAGGAEQFVRAPRPKGWAHPGHVQKWANQLYHRLHELNRKAGEFTGPSKSPFVEPTGARPARAGLITLREWKELSTRDVGPFALRTGPVKRIDDLLATFHSQVHYHDESMAILAQIMDEVHTYLVTRSGHKRMDAIVELGTHVIEVLDYYRQMWGGMPLPKEIETWVQNIQNA